MQEWYEKKWHMLAAASALYVLMFVLMGIFTDIYDTADFFNVEIAGSNPSNNPRILGVPVTTAGEFWMFIIFFFFNAFSGVWLRVLIVERYNLFVADPSVKKLSDEYPKELFLVYNLWKSAGFFFNILGIFSNVFFFLSTVMGALVGNVAARSLLLSVKEVADAREDVAAKYDINSIGSLHRQ